MDANNQKYLVISASRMTDLPAYYPQFMIDTIEKRIKLGQKIHSVVIWTKHANALNKEPLRSYLQQLKNNGIQLSIQLTITGMGRKLVGESAQGKLWSPEPNVPKLQDSIDQLVNLVHLVDDARRITIRIDPIAKFRFSDGSSYTNQAELSEIIALASNVGIKRFAFSLLEPYVYKKVIRRFNLIGIEIQSFTLHERMCLQAERAELEQRFDCEINACCVEGFPASACVSGKQLSSMHPKTKPFHLKCPLHVQCACVQNQLILVVGRQKHVFRDASIAMPVRYIQKNRQPLYWTAYLWCVCLSINERFPLHCQSQ